MALSQKAIDALLNVKAYILAEPLRVNMQDGVFEFDMAPCGTAGCIAGWLYLLENKKLKKDDWKDDKRDSPIARGLSWWSLIEPWACDFLGLDQDVADSVSSEPLFYVDYWPREFRDRIMELHAHTPEYAQVVAERIDAFIEENK